MTNPYAQSARLAVAETGLQLALDQRDVAEAKVADLHEMLDILARGYMHERASHCEVTHDGRNACKEPPHGVRFEHGFLDVVCQAGRINAEGRGVPVYPREVSES